MTKRPFILILAMAFPLAPAGCQPRHTSRVAENAEPDSRVMVRTVATPRAGEAQPQRQVELTVRDEAAARVAGSLVGRQCRVQLRRDALGMANPTPVAPTAAFSAPGRSVALDGRITQLLDDWVVLEMDGKSFWIPQSSVLMIEVRE